MKYLLLIVLLFTMSCTLPDNPTYTVNYPVKHCYIKKQIEPYFFYTKVELNNDIFILRKIQCREFRYSYDGNYLSNCKETFNTLMTEKYLMKHYINVDCPTWELNDK
jgi:hypothetical protein